MADDINNEDLEPVEPVIPPKYCHIDDLPQVVLDELYKDAEMYLPRKYETYCTYYKGCGTND